MHVRIDADLAQDRHYDLIPELTALVAEHPLHEGLVAWGHSHALLTELGSPEAADVADRLAAVSRSSHRSRPRNI